MIEVAGVLTVRIISGRNGDFAVGRLVTDAGEFAVKEALLDEYPEGQYRGRFTLARIYASHYSAGGRLIVEVRAQVVAIVLDEVNTLDASEVDESALREVDPLESETPAAQPSEEAPADDATLFGLLWPLGARVKLDSTVERAQLRRQADRLKQWGYRFEPFGQTWELLPGGSE